MPKLNPWYATFYGGTILVVLGLFQVVTHYGAQLQAAPRLDGRYRLSLNTRPDCTTPPTQSTPLVLTIQQSGIYLNAFLLPESSDDHTVRSAEKRPSLTGRWQAQEMAIAGPTGLQLCDTGTTTRFTATATQPTHLVLRMLPGGKTLQGKLQQGTGPLLEFTGERVVTAETKPTAH